MTSPLLTCPTVAFFGNFGSEIQIDNQQVWGKNWVKKSGNQQVFSREKVKKWT